MKLKFICFTNEIVAKAATFCRCRRKLTHEIRSIHLICANNKKNYTNECSNRTTKQFQLCNHRFQVILDVSFANFSFGEGLSDGWKAMKCGISTTAVRTVSAIFDWICHRWNVTFSWVEPRLPEQNFRPHCISKWHRAMYRKTFVDFRQLMQERLNCLWRMQFLYHILKVVCCENTMSKVEHYAVNVASLLHHMVNKCKFLPHL